MAVPKSLTIADKWLVDFGGRIARAHAAIRKLDRKKVELDIAARKLELAAAKDYKRNRSALWKHLDAIGMTEHAWLKKQGKGNSLSRWRRRLQLLKPGAFRRYLYHRRETATPDVFGLEYAVVLSKLDIPGEEDEIGTDTRPETRVVCADGTLDPQKGELITGDCTEEMRKKPPEWYHIICTSFPYWPARRSNHPEGKPIGIGFEPTCEEWLDNMVLNVGREKKRVLRDDGVLWVMLDDAIALPPVHYAIQTYNRNRATTAKQAAQTGFKTQDSTYLRPEGNWLLLPFRYAMRMQDDGWCLRDIIIIDKGVQGRQESSETRTRHNFEYAFMFTKSPDNYYYDQDALRVPLAQPITPASLVGSDGPRKQGVIRGLDFRGMSNPMGRVHGAVWHLPVHYTGEHSATFSEEFARRCLVTTCPPGGRVLDPFVGSGTVAVAASKLGLQFTGIDQNPAYIEEARQRVLSTPTPPIGRDSAAANDNQEERDAEKRDT